jgi:L-alanine-DL-glutamate epimerase-like enolase superfamily enzyme
LAAEYRGQGFQTLKLKVGKNLNSDIEVQKAIRLVHPDCSFILDANEGYTRNQAIEVLDRLNGMFYLVIYPFDQFSILYRISKFLEHREHQHAW